MGMLRSDHLYAVGEQLLMLAAESLEDSYGGVPDRRMVIMSNPVHDVPDQLTVHIEMVMPNLNNTVGTFQYGYDGRYVLTITRPYPMQPGDGGVMREDFIAEATMVLYEDANRILTRLNCDNPLDLVLDQMQTLEPLGGVAGWQFYVRIPLTAF
jgi:hypothetical protein